MLGGGDGDDDELPYVDHGPMARRTDEGPSAPLALAMAPRFDRG